MLDLATGFRPQRILCLGAHSDDIEIGCGGTLLSLLSILKVAEVDWIVLAASGPRREEARESSVAFLEQAGDARVRVEDFRERYFPHLPELKEYFDLLGKQLNPDVVFAPSIDDKHQDHRMVGELSRNTFRDHLILHYEIPKSDGDLGRPWIYFDISGEQTEKKLELIWKGFPSQHYRPWFEPELFRSLMRIRGMESRSPSGYAEAFHADKLKLAGL